MSVVVYKEGGFYDVKPQTWLTNNKAVFYHLLPKKHVLEDQILSYRLDLSAKLSNFHTPLFYFDYQHLDYYCPTNVYVKASRFDLCHQALKKALLTRAFRPLAPYRQRHHQWTLRNHCVLTKGPSGFGKFITHMVSTRPQCECFNIEFIPQQLILDQRMLQWYPQPSANFREPATLDWLHAISESYGIWSTILAVIHPKLYDAG